MDKDVTQLQRLAATGDAAASLRLSVMNQRLGTGFRTLRSEINGKLVYESTFDLLTGSISRKYLNFDVGYGSHNSRNSDVLAWNKRYTYGEYLFRHSAFSPVPETVDIAINTFCGFGCDFCYTGANKNGRHMELDLLKEIITGFDQPPYQMAFGGGSPTHHPEFVQVLRMTRELGVVPNYTTEGTNLTDSIMDATNQYCGGVALTCHLWKGEKHFVYAYSKLKEALPYKQINVHVIADKHVIAALAFLNSLKLGPMNIVLLAYYPDVGRSTFLNIMDKETYSKLLPEAIRQSIQNGHRIAFSEGLLPYFLSRQEETGIDMRMAARMEGYFSCYVDINGRMSRSSFRPKWGEDENKGPRDYGDSAYNTLSQELWERLGDGNEPTGGQCGQCQFKNACSTPDNNHYLICKYSEINEPESQPISEDYFNYYDGDPKIDFNNFRMTITSGFITNSSSVIYHFDERVLDDPEIKRFLTAYEIRGYIGNDLWSRSGCMTVALTREDKQRLFREMNDGLDEDSGLIDHDNNGPIVIYGDEYQHVTEYIAELMNRVSVKNNYPVLRRDYL